MNNSLATFLTLAIFSLIGIAASIGHRVYTYVKFVPQDKWLEPALIPATISIPVGILCTFAAFVFLISLYKEGKRFEDMTFTDDQIQIKTLQRKLADSESKNKTLDTRNTDLVNSKSKTDLELRNQKDRTEQLERWNIKPKSNAPAPAPAPAVVKPTVYTPPAPAPRYTPPQPTTVNVKQVNRGCGSGCGWWLLALIISGPIVAILFLNTCGPGMQRGMLW